MSTYLAWFFILATVLLWLGYKRRGERVAALTRQVRLLHETIALERQSTKLAEDRAALLEIAVTQHQARIALLVGENVQLEREQKARDLYPLPVTGTIINQN